MERITKPSRPPERLHNNITCMPLTRVSVASAFNLLREFTKGHNLKKDFRNSLNDILILTTAIESSAKLNTEDSELSKFASQSYAGQYQKGSEFTTIDFSQITPAPHHKNKESKGYVNNGWRAVFKNYHLR